MSGADTSLFCGPKLWRYDKIEPGEVLRCHKVRIQKMFSAVVGDNGRIYCKWGKDIGIDKVSFYKMITKAVTYRGTKGRACTGEIGGGSFICGEASFTRIYLGARKNKLSQDFLFSFLPGQ